MEIKSLAYSYAEVNLSALKHNFRYLCSLNKGKTPICVLKDDAYGHGIEKCAKALYGEGARYFATANVREAARIRESGIKCEILVLGYVAREDIAAVLQKDITVCLYSLSFARDLGAEALKRGVRAKAHIALNTGLNRLGFDCESPSFGKSMITLAGLEGLDINGAYTHYSSADEKDIEGCRKQQDKFKEALFIIKKSSIGPELWHISNSAAAMCPGCGFENAFRVGIALFGVSPLPKGENGDKLRPVMSFRARVANTLHVKKGGRVGYGGKFIAEKDMKIAVLCAGFAMGYFRGLSDTACVWIKGRRAPVVGSICMDMISIDISGIKGVNTGDEAELFGYKIAARELCDAASTVCDELFCAVGRSVERVYVQSSPATG